MGISSNPIDEDAQEALGLVGGEEEGIKTDMNERTKREKQNSYSIPGWSVFRTQITLTT